MGINSTFFRPFPYWDLSDGYSRPMASWTTERGALISTALVLSSYPLTRFVGNRTLHNGLPGAEAANGGFATRESSAPKHRDYQSAK
jgi:hypothetical protein